MQKLTIQAKNEGESQGKWDEAGDEAGFQPLSAEEAQQWRERHPALSPWRIVAWQAAAGVLAAGLTGLVWLASGWAGSAGFLAGSVLYGALAVVVPASLLARVMARQAGAASVTLRKFFIWELAKLALTVALLAAAPWLFPGLNWLALVGGLVVAMKAHAVAAWFEMRRISRSKRAAPGI